MKNKKLVAAIVLVAAIAMGVYYGVSANAPAAADSVQQTAAALHDASSPCCEMMKAASATLAAETDTSGACGMNTAAQCPYLTGKAGCTGETPAIVPVSADMASAGSATPKECPFSGGCCQEGQTPPATTTVASADTSAE